MLGAYQFEPRFTPSLWRTVAPPGILAEAHYGIYSVPSAVSLRSVIAEQAVDPNNIDGYAAHFAAPLRERAAGRRYE